MGLWQRVVDTITISNKKQGSFAQTKENPYNHGSFVTQKYWVDSKQIDTDVLDELYTRNGLAHNVIEVLADKVFNKWLEIDSENPKFSEAVKELDKRHTFNLRAKLKKAYKYRWRHGYSILIFFTKDSAPEGMENPMGNIREVTDIQTITKRAVKEIHYEQETRKAGAITAITLKHDYIGTDEDVKIHPSRFMIIGDVNDRGILFPAFNYLQVYDNIIWATGQSFWRYAAGILLATIENASENERKELQEMMENFTARTYFVGDQRYKFEFTGINGKGLSPKEYEEVAMKAAAMSMGFPYALLEGAHAGTISGSETNSSELYDKIESIQRTEVQPDYEHILELFTQSGQIPKDEHTIKWNPLWQLSAKEMAEIEYLQAQADEVKIYSGVLSPNEVRKNRNHKNRESDKDYDREGGDNYQESSDQSTNTRNAGADSNLPPPARDAVGLRTTIMSRLEDNDEIESAINEGTKKIAKLYNYPKLKTAINQFQPNKATDDDRSEFLAKVDAIIDANGAEAREVVDYIINNAWTIGAVSARELLGKDVQLSAEQLLQRGELKASLLDAVKGVNADVKRTLRNTLLEGLQLSQDPRQIQNFMRKKLDEIKSSLPESRIRSIVRTETNRAFTDVSETIYETSGVKKWRWITAGDDKVRPDHAINNGQVVPIGSSFRSGYIKPPAGVNCRCDVIPEITEVTQ